MAQLKRVIIIGAGGNTGAIILRHLLASTDFEVTVLSRSSSESVFPPEVTVIRSDYSEGDLARAFRGQDVVVSAVGAVAFLEQKVFVDAAISAGVQRFIPSEFSINTLSDAVRELVPVFVAKKEVLGYLKARESTGLTWTGLAPGLLFDWGLHSGFLGFDLANKKATVWDGGKNVFSITNQDDLGRAVVSILTHPAETANKYLYVATVTTTQKAILDSLEAQSGHAWTKEHCESEEKIANGRKQVSEGDYSGLFTLVQASAYGSVPGTRANYAAEEELANPLLGIGDGSVDDTVKEALKAYA